MDKLNMQTTNIVDENIKRIGELFPNCLTERLNDEGKPEVAIDFDQLRQELSKDIVEGAEERYQFTWPDKRNAIRLANAPTTDTLRPCREESVDFDNTQNLYIEGDNLQVLKLLRENYLGKVKMIYIDPPYNTGNDFVYNDDFSQSAGEYMHNSGQEDEEGNRLVANSESNGRFHTDWLNMIYPRLKVAKDLLSEDGVIFISIDDNELKNLISLGNLVFGEACFVSNVIWQKNYSAKNNSQGVPATTEYIVVYSRKPSWMPKRLSRTEEMNSKYKNPDNDVAPWRSDNPCAPGASTHQGMVYAIQHPFTGELLYPYNGACWRYQQDDLLEVMNGWCKYHLVDLNDAQKRAEICGISPNDVRKGVKGIILKEDFETSKREALKVLKNGPWPKFYFTKNGEGGIARKTYLTEVEGRLVTSFWPHTEVGHTDGAKKELKNLFDGKIPFDTPKPTELIERMLEISSDSDSVILDFFSGSATTAHAVMNANAKDNGSRRFILVQLEERTGNPEYPTICEIGKERIRRAGKKIKEESPLTTHDLDTGFRVLKLDTSNMQDVYYTPAEFNEQKLFDDNIKPDRIGNDGEDLLFQAMIELGIELSAKIEKRSIAGKAVWSVSDGYLMACFDEEVNETTITEIARQHPYYFVMRDSSLANDQVADNFEQIWEEYSKDTVRRIL